MRGGRAILVTVAAVGMICLAAGLAGSAVAWNDTDDGLDDRIGEWNGSGEDRIESAVDGARTTGERTVADTTDAFDGSGADGEPGDATEPDGSTAGDGAGSVTASVGGDRTAADVTVPRVEATGAVESDVVATVTWVTGNGDGPVVALRTPDRRPPDVPTVPADTAGLDPVAVAVPSAADRAVPSDTTGAGGIPGTAGAAGVTQAGLTDGQGSRTALGAGTHAVGDPGVLGGGTVVDSLDSVAAVLASGAAVPVWAVILLLFVKPLVGALSGVGALLWDAVGRVIAIFRYGSEEDPLTHDLRSRMVDWIEATPGVTLSELAERTEASLSTVRHHARVLERERLVRSDKIRGNRRFFGRGTEHEELIAALDGEVPGTIIGELRDRETATVGDLVEAADRSYSTVSYHLDRLAEDGIVAKSRDGPHTVTRLEPWVESALDADGPERAPERGRTVGAD
jgi:predicted transcriptional regulator